MGESGHLWESFAFLMLSLHLLFASSSSSCLESRHHTWQFSSHLVTLGSKPKDKGWWEKYRKVWTRDDIIEIALRAQPQVS